jgi:hypothetical protein
MDEGSSHSGLTLTKAQYHHLISLLQNNTASGHLGPEDNPKPNSSSLQSSAPNTNLRITYVSCFTSTHALSFIASHTTPWIIDSGATDHISCSLNHFLSYDKIPPVKINLPNGAFVFAHYSGIVQFSRHFVLYNVLYVPEFNFNLLSISKILSKFSHSLFFHGDSCTIQDVNFQRMIGLAKLKKGLYHLEITKNNHSPSTNSFTTNPITKNNLWHFRLGHLSSNLLNILHEQFPFISKHSNEACDVCHLAKQRKLSYSTSDTHALKPFHLLWIFGVLHLKSLFMVISIF